MSDVISATFTRPANVTAYASGQLCANSTTAGLVVPMAFTYEMTLKANSGLIRGMRLKKSSASLTTASFRAHLYTASPVCANGDGAAWSTDKVQNYIGAMDGTFDRAFTDGAHADMLPINNRGEAVYRVRAGETIYCLLEAKSAYTPTSGEILTGYLELIPD
jgi:hypothetical protein